MLILQTKELLQQENVIIYEPAIQFENFFIRVDVLVKTGNKVDLIEVKAKYEQSLLPRKLPSQMLYFSRHDLLQNQV